MRKGIIAGVLSGACWGTVFLAPVVVPDTDPFIFAVSRYFFYGVASLIYAFFSKSFKVFRLLNAYDVKILFFLSFSGSIIYYIFVVKGTYLIGIAPVALIQGLVPMSGVLFGRSSTTPNLKELMPPIALILLGLFALNADVFTEFPKLSVYQKTMGIVYAFIALASWSYFAILNARYLQTHKNFSAGDWSMLYGMFSGITAVLFCAILPFKEVLNFHPAVPNLRGLLFVSIGLAVLSSSLGNLFWNIAAAKLPLSLSSQLIVFETIFALIYGFVYYGRQPRFLETVAIGCLLAGILWSIRRHRGISHL